MTFPEKIPSGDMDLFLKEWSLAGGLYLDRWHLGQLIFYEDYYMSHNIKVQYGWNGRRKRGCSDTRPRRCTAQTLPGPGSG
jgi:hypothetical protein